LQVAMSLFKDIERRDPAELLGDGKLPPFIQFQSQREFVRKVVVEETQMRKNLTKFVDEADEGGSSIVYRESVNQSGSPSTIVSDTYSWTPGTELARVPAEV
jgi:hypothetical protein